MVRLAHYVTSRILSSASVMFVRPLSSFTSTLARQQPRLLTRPGVALRLFSSSIVSHSQEPQYPIHKDPSHPSLYYHLRPAPNALSPVDPSFALSFLGKPLNEAYPTSRTIIGWLPAEESSSLQDFKENGKFLGLLHETIEATLNETGGDAIIEADAVQRVQGWLHINDMRAVPPLGRIGDPDDIIASVRVEEGKIIPHTYQRMPSYRLCTADGLTQLTEGLAKRLDEELHKEWENEQSGRAKVQ